MRRSIKSHERTGGVGKTLRLAKHLLVGIAVAFAAALSLAGCGANSAPQVGEKVSKTSDALVTANSGSAYAQQCLNAGVPLPPVWGSSTIGSTWQTSSPTKTMTDSWASGPGDVYFNVSGGGMCVILSHYGGRFDVICQGTNGKACFWEGPTMVTPPNPSLVIASTDYSQGGLPAGTQLTAKCTSCHAGQNVFVAHNIPNHPLNLAGNLGWMPSVPNSSAYQDPIVPAGWPQAPASTVNYPASCVSCHHLGGPGGAFPDLATATFTDGYCGILKRVTSMPGSMGGMPPSSTCLGNGNNDCPSDVDPDVKSMLAACGAPNPPVPLSLSGINSPGVGAQFQAGARHDSRSEAGEHQHYFSGATATMPNSGCCTNQTSHPVLKPTDVINVSVYLPTDDAPREVMLQFYDGANWHRGYWGTYNLIGWAGSSMGPLPTTGSWQVLSFTAGDFGLAAGTVLSGMAFTLFDGSASWADVLFKSSDAPFNGQFVSQVWLGDHLTAGASPAVDGADFWSWQPTNLATATGLAYMTSSLDGGPASRGIDGNVDGNYVHSSVFHTGTGYDSTFFGLGTGGEYWYVDLGSVRNIKRVVLYNRTDCCQDRLSHFRINYFDPVLLRWTVASDQSNTITTATNPIIPLSFPSVKTQYLQVQKADANYLHLSEVEVFGDL